LQLGLAQALQAGSTERPGRIQFSDGELLKGNISWTPGTELKIHDGQSFRTIALDRVQQILMTPEQEELVQKWKFVEAGKTLKEHEGRPYPSRQLRATVLLSNGEKVTGHLYTTVLYLEGQERPRKIILWAKQRGPEGTTLDALTYPTQIRFTESAASDA